MPCSSSRTGTASAPSTSSRSRNGGKPGALDDDAVAEAHELPERARDRVERAVDDHDRLGRRRPRRRRAPRRAPGSRARPGSCRSRRGPTPATAPARARAAAAGRACRARGRGAPGRSAPPSRASAVARPSGCRAAHEAARTAAGLDESRPRRAPATPGSPSPGSRRGRPRARARSEGGRPRRVRPSSRAGRSPRRCRGASCRGTRRARSAQRHPHRSPSHEHESHEYLTRPLPPHEARDRMINHSDTE